MTGGLKRDLTFLQLMSPAVAEKEPRTQTRCGGLLMLLCMPVAIVAYSVVWFHDWYITDRGALQVVEWGHFGEKIEGVSLDTMLRSRRMKTKYSQLGFICVSTDSGNHLD